MRMWFTANVKYGNDIHFMVSEGPRLLLLQLIKMYYGGDIHFLESKGPKLLLLGNSFMPEGGEGKVLYNIITRRTNFRLI